jgi:serine/threonine-protein kinase
MASPADPQLLFGLFALQNSLIDHEQLLTGFRAWTRDRSRPLADHLSEHGYLDAAGRAAVEAIVALHLQRHGGDPGSSLAALRPGRSTLEALTSLADSEVLDSLATVMPSSLEEPAGWISPAGESHPAADSARFRVLHFHAKGNLGAVYKALDAQLNREVALKQILENRADDPATRARFLLEGEITGRLEHPGIVPVYGLGTLGDGRPYYAMRFVRGETLKEAISSYHANKSDAGERNLAFRRLLRRFIDVGNAVDYAHSRGVLHRDLKPANIVVGPHGETLVVDWGLAKAMGHRGIEGEPGEGTLVPTSGDSTETRAGSIVGTPAYMSPEQAAGDLERLGPRSDVYGLGAILYTILTGKPPYSSVDLEVVKAGKYRPPRQLDPAIDAALEAICLKAMAVEPVDRYATAKTLAEDVDRWLGDEPVTAWREPLLRRLRRWTRNNRVAVTAAAATLLVATVGLGVVSAVQSKANADLRQLNREKDDANTALRESNRQKEEANASLQLANKRVEERFDLARDAIRTFTTSVQQDDLLKNEKLKPVRDKLLRSAAGFYEKLEKLLQGQTDRKSKAMLAQSYEELGDLIKAIGVQTEALAIHRKALAIRRELVAKAGSGAAERDQLSRSLLDIGNLAGDTGDNAAALTAYTEHREILSRLATENPAVKQYQNDLAISHNNLGNLLRATGDNPGALAAYRRALGIREKLAAENPAVTEYQNDLARSHNNLGLLLSATGDTPGALAAYRRALGIREKLAAENPAVTEYKDGVSITHYNTACFHALEALRLTRESRLDAMEEQKRLSMSELKQTIATGFRDLKLLHSDPDLNILRARPDFQRLLLDLAFPEQPFAP